MKQVCPELVEGRGTNRVKRAAGRARDLDAIGELEALLEERSQQP